MAGLLGLERVGKGIRGAPRDALVAGSVGPEHFGKAYFCEGIAKLVASPLFGLLYFLFAAPEHPESGAHVAFGFGAACAGLACILLVILLGVFRRREA